MTTVTVETHTAYQLFSLQSDSFGCYHERTNEGFLANVRCFSVMQQRYQVLTGYPSGTSSTTRRFRYIGSGADIHMFA